MTRHKQLNHRAAFTLVEMLVSTALIIFILAILSSVFTTGINALRSLRGIGHLQEHLRDASAMLRRDLASPHFGRETDGVRGPYLSQQRLDLYDWAPPKEGFFRIWQGAPSTFEDTNGDGTINVADADGDGLFSYKAFNHALHFTVRVEPNTAQGAGRDQFFFTRSFSFVPPRYVGGTLQTLDTFRMGQSPSHISDSQTIYSPWAEVAYFLRPTGQLAGSSPLYSLHRRRRVLIDLKEAVPDSKFYVDDTLATGGGGGTPTPPFSTQAKDVSLYESRSQPPTVSNRLYINTPANIMVPYRRLAMEALVPAKPPSVPAGVFPQSTGFYNSILEEVVNKSISDPSKNPGGDDILLENVLSFEIKANWDIPTDTRLNRNFQNGVGPPKNFSSGPNIQNPEYPFDNLPAITDPQTLQTFGNFALGNLGVGVFDTWRGEDYADPANSPPIRIPYSDWNKYYEVNETLPPRAPNSVDSAVTIPLRIRIKALQIRLRVWDAKTQQARQITIVQDM